MFNQVNGKSGTLLRIYPKLELMSKAHLPNYFRPTLSLNALMSKAHLLSYFRPVSLQIRGYNMRGLPTPRMYNRWLGKWEKCFTFENLPLCYKVPNYFRRLFALQEGQEPSAYGIQIFWWALLIPLMTLGKWLYFKSVVLKWGVSVPRNCIKY